MKWSQSIIASPDSVQLKRLCEGLKVPSDNLGTPDCGPDEQLKRCAQAGVFSWFVAEKWGGLEWSTRDIMRGYLDLAAACLTTTFVITQRASACRRIASSENNSLKERFLPDLAAGTLSTTLGISHLTTSHQHQPKPVLTATREGNQFKLNGFSPWVTAGRTADLLVLGAVTPDDKQLLLVVPTSAEGVGVRPGQSLVALSSSQTGRVDFQDVLVPAENVIAGPVDNVMELGKQSATGGLQTSALAIGLASAAVAFVIEQSNNRTELRPHADALQKQVHELRYKILELADERPICSNEELRTEANSFVLRATQSALVAAKGAGFVEGHCVGRWCREALFFLVWSCPQGVRGANLCEFARISA